MTPMNILIVDDEIFARKQISEIVKKISPKYVITEAFSLKEAKSAISQKDFSIVFLDINLKGELGFDLVPSIPKQTKIIFVTAMNNYAIRAFEVNALDYILKPPTVERVTKALSLLNDESQVSNKALPFSMDDHILVQTNQEIKFIHISEIRYIQADGVYTQLSTSEAKPILVRKSLSEWINSLPLKNFIQIHRSTIINLNKVSKMLPANKGTYKIFIKGCATPFSVSRSFSAVLKERLIV
jgi:DNA-binding LytR/AlgR family response regulator